MIVSIGEALIDIKKNGEFAGGCPFNVSIAVARQGAGISFLGGVSSDEYGQKILNCLIDNCVLFDPVFCSSEKQTAVARVIECEKGEKYEFVLKNTSAFDITKEKLDETFSVNTDIDCAFFGSVSFTDEKAISEILSFFRTKPDLIKFFDPNIRPFAVSDMVSYRKILDETVSLCRIVKVSDEDLKFWERTEEQVFDLCPDNLIVTRGAKGATWYSKSLGKSISVDAVKPERIVDTIGCGDVFSGTILAYLEKNRKFRNFSLTEDEIKTCLNLASKAASVNCTREGCNPPYTDELNA